MVKRIRRDEITRSGGQNEGMERAIAVSKETCGSSGLYTSVVTTTPGGRSEVHHHGECETSIYVLHGRARFLSGEGLADVVVADEATSSTSRRTRSTWRRTQAMPSRWLCC
jgi:uncharacterized RmlC-like cupin family protein